MREIEFEDVRPGDVARSNGKEVKVREVRLKVVALHAGEGTGVRWFTPGVANALGVSFWREDRRLPDYPGAWVRAKGVGQAVRALTDEGDGEPWFTNEPDWCWRSDAELLEWLGPDWEELSKPPARWAPVDPADIEAGDYVRAERDGGAREGKVKFGRDGNGVIGIYGVGLCDAERFAWFKREGGEE